MKTSELIKHLQEELCQYGDKDVKIQVEDSYGTGVNTYLNGVDGHTNHKILYLTD